MVPGQELSSTWMPRYSKTDISSTLSQMDGRNLYPQKTPFGNFYTKPVVSTMSVLQLLHGSPIEDVKVVTPEDQTQPLELNAPVLTEVTESPNSLGFGLETTFESDLNSSLACPSSNFADFGEFPFQNWEPIPFSYL
jgi:hypothetical protein